MNFGEALEKIKQGKVIAREGWNGKGMFVYLVTGGDYPVQMDCIKHLASEKGTLKYNPYMAIKNVNGTISTWVPSVNDCLAEDWYTLETEKTENNIPDHILRMETEFNELIKKIQKLRDFLEKEIQTPDKTNAEQRELLILQAEYMYQYSMILDRRLYLEKRKI